MKILLDTCTFLWIVLEPAALSAVARALVADPSNDVFLSAVSGWEIAVKHALGRLPLPEEPSAFVAGERARRQITSLPLDELAALTLGKLPRLHHDPFDRMLVCQAIMGGLTIRTPDAAVRAYPVPTVW